MGVTYIAKRRTSGHEYVPWKEKLDIIKKRKKDDISH
jgi:hypothetical protein